MPPEEVISRGGPRGQEWEYLSQGLPQTSQVEGRAQAQGVAPKCRTSSRTVTKAGPAPPCRRGPKPRPPEEQDQWALVMPGNSLVSCHGLPKG